MTRRMPTRNDLESTTACLVTRGDQPAQLERIRSELVFPNVIVWDNSRAAFDAGVAGRYFAALQARTPRVYFQDDDVIVPRETQLNLAGAYRPGVLVATWGHGTNPDGYDDLPLVCGGAVSDRELAWPGLSRYLELWPADLGFRMEADFVAGVLYPEFDHVTDAADPGFDITLEIAQHPSRLVNQPWQKELKLAVTERARAIRDAAQ